MVIVFEGKPCSDQTIDFLNSSLSDNYIREKEFTQEIDLDCLNDIRKEIDEIYQKCGIEKGLELNSEVVKNLKKLRREKKQFQEYLYSCLYIMKGNKNKVLDRCYIRDSSIFTNKNSSSPISVDTLIGEGYYSDILDVCLDKHRKKMKKIFEILKDYTSLLNYVYGRWDGTLGIVCGKKGAGNFYPSGSYLFYRQDIVDSESSPIRIHKISSESFEKAKDKFNRRGGSDRKFKIRNRESRKYDLESVERNVSISEDVIELIYVAKKKTNMILSMFREMKEKIENLTLNIIVSKHI